MSEPNFGDGPALQWPAESEQEAEQRRYFLGDGEGTAAAEARKREA